MSQPASILDFDTPVEDYLLDEPLMFDGLIASFASNQVRSSQEHEDIELLRSIPFPEAWYGGITPPLHRLIVTPNEPLQSLPTASTVLRLLRASCFCSEHIPNLEIAKLEFPGYHPTTKNDEVHTDPEEQHIFAVDSKIGRNHGSEHMKRHDASRNAHTALADLVLSRHLYYVLVHTRRHDFDGFLGCNYVLLFAVGVSPRSGSLIGVVTHQVCHNLCD
jgi:hypothetical protein